MIFLGSSMCWIANELCTNPHFHFNGWQWNKQSCIFVIHEHQTKIRTIRAFYTTDRLLWITASIAYTRQQPRNQLVIFGSMMTKFHYYKFQFFCPEWSKPKVFSLLSEKEQECFLLHCLTVLHLFGSRNKKISSAGLLFRNSILARTKSEAKRVRTTVKKLARARLYQLR